MNSDLYHPLRTWAEGIAPIALKNIYSRFNMNNFIQFMDDVRNVHGALETDVELQVVIVRPFRANYV